MSRIPSLVLTVALFLGSVASEAARTTGPPDVAPGQKGICITEMGGGEHVRIPVTVLGTAGPAAPEGEMVLVRLDDPRFERTGIIAGMSGSPVYVGGRLVGALAFGWSFEREPIGGVTPFSRMEAIGSGGAGGPVPDRPALALLRQAWRGPEPGRAVLDWLLPEPAAGSAVPLPLAVVAAGGAAVPAGWLGEAWRRMGWVASPAPVGGGGSRAEGTEALGPGDMVAGILVSGDATLAVGGTVTEVRGDRVWAFGHPFLGGGRYAMPMARAHVLAVLPNLEQSFKFFTVGAIIGAFEQDRRHGMTATLGAPAPMVPLTVHAGGRSYRFQALRHPVLLPLLASYLTSASQGVHGKTFGQQTLRCSVTLGWSDGKTATVAESFPELDAPGRASALVSAVVGYVEASPFPHPPLARIVVSLEQVERVRQAEVVRVVPERHTVRPGQDLAVTVTMGVRGEGLVTRKVTIRVPPETPEGPLDLIVADGASWTDYALRSWPLTPRRFDDELELLGRLVPSTVLVVALEGRGTGLVLPGGAVAVPPSRALALSSTLGEAARPIRRLVTARTETPVPWPVAAAERIRLRVDGRRRSPAGSVKEER